MLWASSYHPAGGRSEASQAQGGHPPPRHRLGRCVCRHRQRTPVWLPWRRNGPWQHVLPGPRGGQEGLRRRCRRSGTSRSQRRSNASVSGIFRRVEAARGGSLPSRAPRLRGAGAVLLRGALAWDGAKQRPHPPQHRMTSAGRSLRSPRSPGPTVRMGSCPGHPSIHACGDRQQL